MTHQEPVTQSAYHEPTGIAGIVNKSMSRISSSPSQSVDAVEADRAQSEQRSKEGKRERTWQAIVSAAGNRYRECRLGKWEYYGTPAEQSRQRAVVAQLHDLCSHMDEHIQEGGNVILYGPPGTGKDFLGVSIMRAAVAQYRQATWLNGMEFFAQCYAVIRSKTETEDDVVKQHTGTDVLMISDPAPPFGESSAYLSRCLFRLVDRRYRNNLGTWITLNAASVEEASAALTAPVFDRLRQRAITAFCNWTSFRPHESPAWKKSPREPAASA